VESRKWESRRRAISSRRRTPSTETTTRGPFVVPLLRLLYAVVFLFGIIIIIFFLFERKRLGRKENTFLGRKIVAEEVANSPKWPIGTQTPEKY
jgi:hypothetical protein